MANTGTSKKSVFETLNSINVNGHTEKKNGLTYLSWAWAWQEAKKAYPEANYKVYENADGWNYFTDGKTCWVKTGVIIDDIEHIEYLPVMDFRNKSIPVDAVTSFDVNKAIQRSLTKALARHGLGLYIYAGEDLPDSSDEQPDPAPAPKAPAKKMKKADVNAVFCNRCGNEIMDDRGYTADSIVKATTKNLGQAYCLTCATIVKNERKAKEEG